MMSVWQPKKVFIHVVRTGIIKNIKNMIQAELLSSCVDVQNAQRFEIRMVNMIHKILVKDKPNDFVLGTL